jgi:DNA-binding MurR/RpiR family transcriptional regulator
MSKDRRRDGTETGTPITARFRSATDAITAAYSKLSNRHRRLADFILANPHEAALMTLQDLALASDVSKATADRLATKLGLSGHPELKSLLREQLKQALRPVQELTEMMNHDTGSEAKPGLRSLEEDFRQLEQIVASGLERELRRSGELLARARRVYFVGFGSSAFIAQYGAFCLSALRGGCEAVVDSGGLESVQRKLLDSASGDLAILIAFPRYSDAAVQAARFFHASGIAIIAVTDAASSPLYPFSTISFLTLRKSGWALTGSATGAVAVIEALLRETATAIGVEEVERRSTRLTELLGRSVVAPVEG